MDRLTKDSIQDANNDSERRPSCTSLNDLPDGDNTTGLPELLGPKISLTDSDKPKVPSQEESVNALDRTIYGMLLTINNLYYCIICMFFAEQKQLIQNLEQDKAAKIEKLKNLPKDASTEETKTVKGEIAAVDGMLKKEKKKFQKMNRSGRPKKNCQQDKDQVPPTNTSPPPSTSHQSDADLPNGANARTETNSRTDAEKQESVNGLDGTTYSAFLISHFV